MKTLRLAVSAVISLLFLTSLRPVSAAETRPGSARNSLWKVEGRTNAVYLLGSIHVLKRENYPLAAPIEAAYTNSQVLVFETDMDQMESGAFSMMEKFMLPEGETLKGQLPAVLYTNLVRHAGDAGVPMFLLDRLKPAMAAMTLEVFEYEKLGADPAYGLDKHFFDRAAKDGKKVVSLETIDFQIGLLTGFSKEEGELIVKTTLDDIDKTKMRYGEMVDAWQTGDAAKLAKLLNEAEQQAPAIFKRLVTDRNNRWVPQIEQMLRDGKNVLVIVGAGHLVGEAGVVQLLKAHGFKVTQQ